MWLKLPVPVSVMVTDPVGVFIDGVPLFDIVTVWLSVLGVVVSVFDAVVLRVLSVLFPVTVVDKDTLCEALPVCELL